MDVSEEAEKLKFFNFLKHYDLSQYHDAFLKYGVRRVSHLKHTTDEDLKEIGLQRPEIARLKKKRDENFSTLGKIKKRLSGKDHLFDGAMGGSGSPTQSRIRGSPSLLPGRRVSSSSSITPNRESATSLEPLHESPILISSDQIHLLSKIGEGAQASVYEADMELGGNKIRVAAKCVNTVNNQSNLDQFMKEAESMVQLNHAHITKLYGISIGSPLMMIEELATYGNLNQFLKTYSDRIHLAMMYTYILQVANAMSYLEARKLIHRDLATRNVLVFKQDHVKLSDFGLARRLRESTDYHLTRTDVPLPTAWLPPESIGEKVFSTSSDVWSFGVFVWEVYSKGQRPWEGYRTVEIKDRLDTGQRLAKPNLCPQSTYLLINECWALEPRERPSFAELFKRLKEPQYVPEIAMVTTPQLVEGNLWLEKNDLLFVLDKPRVDLWVGMTLRGQEVSFKKDLVKCDAMRINNASDTQAVQLDTSSDDQIFSSLRVLGIDQQAKINSHQNFPRDPAPFHVYETSENNPGVDDLDVDTSFEGTYVRMKPSEENILDTPTTEENLPPPIFPTAQALQDLMISPTVNPTNNYNIYSEIDEEEMNREDVNVESTYSVIEMLNFSADEMQSHTPLLLPSDVPFRSSVDMPKPPSPHARNLGPVPNGQRISANSNSHTFKTPHNPFGNEYSSPPERPPPPVPPVQSSEPVVEEALLDIILREFPDVEVEVCIKVFNQAKGDLTLARTELKVHQLMEMGFPYIEEADCTRALDHCQGKTERAAAWLLELSETISARKR